MSVQIQILENATEAERLKILIPLLAHNLANGGDDAHEAFALLLRDPGTNEVIGGLFGKISYRWLLIDLVSVPEQMRNQGIGERLMRMAEEMAQKKHCIGIWLETFSFQAPGFYRKLGYSEFGHLVDYPPGHTRFYFQKTL
ncbi:GNAT family N-acetyltransferase [Burkholderia sp. AU30198]|uniref:GNAT family N-acetyltransferase n=1 Tax=Burkholderia sp. AU30198 TaxID=2879627 RepID=UPI001CF589C9|nr:GNAT family N-acetyltransferase [Burkholderia sp. AU30198]MCA8299222.1 GNAT family N-acetyltransferase [Burkholderia sp. AU30198]